MTNEDEMGGTAHRVVILLAVAGCLVGLVGLTERVEGGGVGLTGSFVGLLSLYCSRYGWGIGGFFLFLLDAVG